MGKLKEVIVVRRELNMRRGKEIAQGGHGIESWLLQEALRSYQTQTPFRFNPQQLAWCTEDNIPKVVLQSDSEEKFEEVAKLAKDAGLDTHIVVDSGRTEFHGVPTKTVLRIGPDWNEKIDEVTGPKGRIPLKIY